MLRSVASDTRCPNCGVLRVLAADVVLETLGQCDDDLKLQFNKSLVVAGGTVRSNRVLIVVLRVCGGCALCSCHPCLSWATLAKFRASDFFCGRVDLVLCRLW